MDFAALELALVSDKAVAALIDDGDHVAIADYLNQPAPGAPTVPFDADVAAITPLLSASELRALPARDFDVVRLYLGTPGLIMAEQLLELAALFPATGVTAGRLQTLAVHAPTRAELLGFVGPVDFSHVGRALAGVSGAMQPAGDPNPTRTFARFLALEDGRAYLPALADGELPDGQEIRFERDGFVDQSLPLQFRGGEIELPPQLLPGTSYYVAVPKGASFAVTDKAGGQPLPLEKGGGLVEFPGLQLKQVRRHG